MANMVKKNQFLTIMLLIFIKKVRAMSKFSLLSGVIVGLFVALAYITQTTGLIHTTPGRNAFLTSSYCVMCPFMYWLLYRLKPTRYNVFAAITCITGVGMISLLGGDGGTGENVLLGDGLTLLCGVFYSLQIILLV